MKKWLIIGGGALVVIIIVLILVLRGNSGNAPTNATLTIWSPFDEQTTFKQISQDYLTANPNITLVYKYIKATDAKDYESQVVNAIANGNGPDIWLVRSDWIPKHIDKSQPATQNGSYSTAIDQVKQTIDSNLVDLNTFNGKLYGLPISADALVLIYNQSLYQQLTRDLTGKDATTTQSAPSTWAELEAQLPFVNQVSGKTIKRSAIALGTVANTYDPGDVFSAFLAQSGVSILSSDNKSVAFNLPQTTNGVTTLPATDALSFYTSFATSGNAHYSWNESMGDPVQAFLNGKTDALIGYYSTLQSIIAANPDFSIKVVAMVQKSATATSRVDYGVTWSALVNKNSSHTSVAWGYLGYIASNSVIKQYDSVTKKLSVLSSDIPSNAPGAVTADNASTLVEAEFPTIANLTSPDWQFTASALEQAINLVIDNNQRPQTAVDATAQQFKSQFIGN